MTLRIETLFRPFHIRIFPYLILFPHKHSPLILALFQMDDNGWSGGIFHAEPGLPKLLILSLERIGVVDPPEYVYRKYDSRGTLRCDVMIFVGRSTRYTDVDPWFISTTGFRFPDTYRKAARKALRHLRVIYKHHLQHTSMEFFPPIVESGRAWIDRMRRLGEDEEKLEDTVHHLSIYLIGLDYLYQEQAAQLKYQIRRAEKTIREREEQNTRAIRAEIALAALRTQQKEREVPRTEEEEEEPEETHWDKGTQTEEEELCLPSKKHRTWHREASP